MVPSARSRQRSLSASLIAVQVASHNFEEARRRLAGQFAPEKNLQSGDFLKNARIPPLGMAPACLQGAPPHPLSIQRSKAD
jgi:hypothetical protein